MWKLLVMLKSKNSTYMWNLLVILRPHNNTYSGKLLTVQCGNKLWGYKQIMALTCESYLQGGSAKVTCKVEAQQWLE